ncbi:undecaprenyldiphospho-muramoylpentapeptide beta-N-acetylglucosaminyltransferase [Campylobacter geochelonis]|uniref:undecaprenyldiphospho-muramoylpentapeptide beta-N-acetylglucosaminyltransferase n=1 Tax=Campylobacter geochelonis TaxID=1780362 RepID=UPI0007709E20|nr:undecaprenyldiphospho-muramoylpentapeptide beta-N-acetylglucosaminyltransferase [Campylobacter geochelonis]CZE49428.1 undecaprenyldiphospho-muramoylpentapeptide beta-N-acetylglucosaminyltransferase [Campylobacter geochelonis]
MSILITGGGTGGHLIIAKTIALELKKRGIKTVFVGSTNGQDKKWFEGSNIFDKTYFLQSSGVVNKSGLAKFNSLFNILKLSFKCKDIFKNEGVEAVLSVGGYSSSPASFWAVFSKTPFFIHEQNAMIGRLNKLLKPFAKSFYSSYEEPKFDYPINEIFFQKARIRQNLNTIIFLGGSQGAKFINNLAMQIAPNLLEREIKIVHQCGGNDFEKVSKFYKEKRLDVDVFDFSLNLASKIEQADLCVGRSGASTLWELCANQLPAIFIPFPYAANDHQFYNAKFLQDMGLCKIFRESGIENEKIIDEILNYDVNLVSQNLAKVVGKNGGEKIVDDMLKKAKFKEV